MAKTLTSWRRGPLSSFSRRPRQFAAGDNAVNTMDLLQFTGTDLIGGMLNEVFRLVPEYSGENPIFGNRISIPGRNVSGKRYETLVRTEVPRGDHFRRFNEPSGNKKAKREKREFEMFPFFDYWEADEQMMEIAPDGGAALMRDDAQAVLEGLVMDLGEYFYYGQTADEDDDRIFPGIIKQTPDGRTHDLGGTGDHLTSIYFLWLDPGLNGVCWLHGAGGSIKTSPMRSRTRDMENGKIDIVEQSIQGWFGLQVKHAKSVFRITNVDISSALTEHPDSAIVDDELLRFAKSQFPTHMIPNLYMFMRPEVFTLWRGTKAPLTDTGFSPPISEFAVFEGMRTVCSESIKINEVA